MNFTQFCKQLRKQCSKKIRTQLYGFRTQKYVFRTQKYVFRTQNISTLFSILFTILFQQMFKLLRQLFDFQTLFDMFIVCPVVFFRWHKQWFCQVFLTADRVCGSSVLFFQLSQLKWLSLRVPPVVGRVVRMEAKRRFPTKVVPDQPLLFPEPLAWLSPMITASHELVCCATRPLVTTAL